MFKVAVLGLLFCLAALSLSAQYVYNKLWDYRYGGTSEDILGDMFIQMWDGGYVIGGSSSSGTSGDKTENNWDSTLNHYDYWIVKLDALGQKQWSKRYGGKLQDNLYQIQQANDGGYILAGDSYSNADGDKSQNCRGGFDYWIVKIDSLGNKQWDKRFGGNGNEFSGEIQSTTDGGYIITGTSTSGLVGDKTQSNWGSGNKEDYWVVKIDSAGNKQWDKRYGGDLYEFGTAIKQTTDGGYLVGGYSTSDSSGDKSQANWKRQYDNFWIVKTDGSGNKLWDKRYGGIRGDLLYCVQTTDNNGFILAGSSYSDMEGDKTQAGNGGFDYWIIKIDSLGNKIWDKAYGATDEDQLNSMAKTDDGGYLLCGDSQSPSGGDKSENNVAGTYVQPWLVKIDSLGNKQWDKTIMVGGRGASYSSAIQSKDGCYVVCSTSWADAGWDKSQSAWNSSTDYWVLKFCMEEYNSVDNGQQATDNGQLQVYPTPFTSDVSIAVNFTQPGEHTATFTITNPTGQTVYQKQESNLASTYTKMLDLSYLPNGVYFIAVEVDGECITKQVVKQ